MEDNSNYMIDNSCSNITRQEFDTFFDEQGKAQYRLRTTVSLDDAINRVKYDNEMGGRIGKGSDEVLIKAEIPLELWSLDPLLKKAAFFKSVGDKALYTHYFNMFLQLQPQLKTDFKQRIFTVR